MRVTSECLEANAAFMPCLVFRLNSKKMLSLRTTFAKMLKDFQNYVMKNYSIDTSCIRQKDKNWKSASDHSSVPTQWWKVSGFPAVVRADVLSMASRGMRALLIKVITNIHCERSRRPFRLYGNPTPFNTQSNVPNARLDQFRRHRNSIQKKDKRSWYI